MAKLNINLKTQDGTETRQVVLDGLYDAEAAAGCASYKPYSMHRPADWCPLRILLALRKEYSGLPPVICIDEAHVLMESNKGDIASQTDPGSAESLRPGGNIRFLLLDSACHTYMLLETFAACRLSKSPPCENMAFCTLAERVSTCLLTLKQHQKPLFHGLEPA